MKELGYGHEYRYAHNEPYAYAAGETYFPEGLNGENQPHFYQPTDRGAENNIQKRLEFLHKLDQEALEVKNVTSQPLNNLQKFGLTHTEQPVKKIESNFQKRLAKNNPGDNS